MWCASSLEIISVAPMINLKHKCYLFPRFVFLTEYLFVIFIKGSQANWPNNLTPYLFYGNCFPHRFYRPFYANIFNIICVTSEIILSFEKASGVDKISLNFVKLSAIILSDSFTKTINDSLSSGICLDVAKIAAVSPIDKGTDNKNSISNFIVSGKRFFINLSASRENYWTKHTARIEEWNNYSDNNEVDGGSFIDLTKCFRCISHDFLIARFFAYVFDSTTLKYVYSYLKKRKQCARINKICSGPNSFNAIHNNFLSVIENVSVQPPYQYYLHICFQPSKRISTTEMVFRF